MLCISYEAFIGTIATLIGVCAVFVTVAPVMYDKRYRELKRRIEDLEKDTVGLRTNRTRVEKEVRGAIEKEKKNKANKARSGKKK